nr:MAG TPA: hypothetical protein [Caudoviricetes sp.]
MDYIRVHNYEGFKDLALEVDKGLLYLEGGAKEREAMLNVMRVVLSRCYETSSVNHAVASKERYDMRKCNILRRAFLKPYIDVDFTTLLEKCFPMYLQTVGVSRIRHKPHVYGDSISYLSTKIALFNASSLNHDIRLDSPILAIYPRCPRNPLFDSLYIGMTKHIYTEPLSAGGPSIESLLSWVKTSYNGKYKENVLNQIELARRMMVKVLTFGACLFGTTEELISCFLTKDESSVRLERIVFDLCLRVASTFSDESMIEQAMKSVSGFVFIDSIDLSSNGDGLRMTEGIKRCFPNITVIATSSKVESIHSVELPKI